MITVLDTETTGLEGSIVEIACVEYPASRRSFMSSLVMPTCPISVEAMACHHITPEMVEDSPLFEEVLMDWPGIARTEIFAAHNAPFDRKFLPAVLQDKPWIDTYRVALHLWPESPGHSNQVLRYWLDLDVSDMPEEAGGMAHRALYDAWCTTRLLERQFEELALVDAQDHIDNSDVMSQIRVISELIRLSTAPVILRKCRFGKHRDELWKDVPRSYLQWILKQDMDPDILFTARHYLDQ